jgi:ribosome-interacting GTPase 1
VLSPILFNVYAEYIIKRSLQNREEGINTNGTIINNIRYADDMVILAESGEQLQILMEILNKESEEMGLTINKRKTKTMVFSKTVNPVQLNIMAGNERIENINSYIYLGREMNSALDHSKEIR